jgi:predicted Zn-dependent protease
MSAWTNATGGKIKFKKAAKPDDVQIYVRFVKNIGKSTNSNTIGLTHHIYSNGRELELIEISEKAPNGRLFSRDARLRVLIHEFGHAIGLDHSNNPKSVMYPTKGSKAILPDDVKTLKYLYGW